MNRITNKIGVGLSYVKALDLQLFEMKIKSNVYSIVLNNSVVACNKILKNI